MLAAMMARPSDADEQRSFEEAVVMVICETLAGTERVDLVARRALADHPLFMRSEYSHADLLICVADTLDLIKALAQGGDHLRLALAMRNAWAEDRAPLSVTPHGERTRVQACLGNIRRAIAQI